MEGFNKVIMWKGQELEDSRNVGIGIYGVPTILIEESILNKIGEKIDKIMIPSDFSWDDNDVSRGKAYVMISNKKR